MIDPIRYFLNSAKGLGLGPDYYDVTRSASGRAPNSSPRKRTLRAKRFPAKTGFTQWSANKE